MILAILALISTFAFVGCQQNTNDPEQVSSDEAISSDGELSEKEKRRLVSDDIPEMSFGETDFYIISSSTEETNYTNIDQGETGSVVEDAAFLRDQNVESRFDVKIVTIMCDGYQAAVDYIENLSKANDSEGMDLSLFHVVASSGLVLRDRALDWNDDVPYINFDKPWWSKSTTNDLTVNGKCLIAVGDVAVSSISCTYTMFFDKVSIKDYTHIANVYELVDNYKWTYDYMYDALNVIYKDINGNSTRDEDDYYGFTMDDLSNVNAFLWAFDNQIFQKDTNGDLKYTFNKDQNKLADIIDKLRDIRDNKEGMLMTRGDHSDGMTKYFAKRKSLFSVGFLGHALNQLNAYDGKYGIVPLPMYSEDQKEYKTMVDGSHSVLIIPKISTDEQLERTGAITEALCAETWKEFLPEYYNVVLMRRAADEPDDSRMIDLIVDSRVFDFGYVYDNWSGSSFVLQALMAEDVEYTSYYARNVRSIKMNYKNMLAQFDIGIGETDFK